MLAIIEKAGQSSPASTYGLSAANPLTVSTLLPSAISRQVLLLPVGPLPPGQQSAYPAAAHSQTVAGPRTLWEYRPEIYKR